MERPLEKRLGKITKAEFGRNDRDRFGLMLTFACPGLTVGDGYKYCVNLDADCKWESEEERLQEIARMVEHAAAVLEAAKVENVSQLLGKPVEVTLDGPCFKDFRILTEVL